MDFNQAEVGFRQLDGQYRSGQISIDQYRAALDQLRVTDAQGNLWQMQESTGVWYRLAHGQWVPGEPPREVPAPVPVPPALVGQPQKAAKPPQRKKSPWGLIGIIGGGLIGWTLIVILIVSQVKGDDKGKGKGNIETYRLEEQETFTLNPGQSVLQDDYGTTLQVAPEALPAEDTVTQLTAYEASGELEKQLSENYTLETPFYEITLQGSNDGSGDASLSLPASNPNSRLLMIVDMQGAILLDEMPVNGVLTTSAHLGPTDLSVLYPDASTSQVHNVMYAVVTPKEELGSARDGSPSVQMAAVSSEQQSYGKTCSPFSLRALTIFQHCQSNEDGTVMVIYPWNDQMTSVDAYYAAKEIEYAMNAYVQAGYTNANLSSSKPLLAVVSSSYTSPEYNFKNGVIYLPPDIPKKLDAEQSAIQHETGHWIQNRVYSMAIAKGSDARKWWIDVSAELMVMDIDPSYISSNITVYGKITKDDGITFAFQSAPYQWPADFYVHAQLVKVNMCDVGCPITLDDFLRAINTGRYPFNGNYEREKLTSNLEEYARYLIGVSPQNANTGISLAGVQNQDEYGQIITVMRGNDTLVKYNTNGDEPQLKEEKTQIGMNLLINAPLEQDGVYPLQITSGSNGNYTGLPLMLVVEPGVPFLYREDNGEVITSDGSEKVRIGPIQAGTGIGTIRLVAYSKTGGQTFTAKIEPVNLDGTWVIGVGNLVSNTIQCTGREPGEEPTDPDDIAALGTTFFSLIGAMGEMTTDSSGQTLEWSMLPERLPEGVSSADFTYQATAITETDGIRLQGRLYFPEPTSFLPGAPAVARISDPMRGGALQTRGMPLKPFARAGLVVVVLLPALGISLIPLSKKRQRLGIVLALGMMVLVLVGCFGMAFYGTIDADIKITKFEYAGGSGPASWTFGSQVQGDAIWVFKEGTATFPIDFFMEAVVEDFEGNKTTTLEECSGTATYSVTGGIYEDMTVIVATGSE